MWEALAPAVVLVDAVRSGEAPGTIHRFDASAQALPAAAWRRAGHAVGLAEAIELARSLRRLPPRLIVLGVEGERFELGGGHSAAVAAAITPLTAAVRAEVRALRALVSR